jgi:hypothetical protein
MYSKQGHLALLVVDPFPRVARAAAKMKRQTEEQQSFELFPMELLLEIARSDWSLSGAIARTCHALLRLFTSHSILKEMIDAIKTSGRPLFKWLTFALPFSFVSTSPSPKQPLKSYEKGALLSGGFVCQLIYNKSWESDVDIFVPRQWCTSRKSEMQDGLTLDVISKQTTPIQRVLETFDLSIVQQGFVDDVYYVTPLAIYTRHFSEIIATPCAANISYNVQRHKITRNVFHYIALHYSFKHDAEFHECKESLCNGWMKELVAWKSRVAKYHARFPSFPIVYIQPEVS